MNDQIHSTLSRKESVLQVPIQKHTTLQRAAVALSRRTIDQATVELLNEALARLCLLCYERDDSDQLCNVDPATGRVLIPVPWGKLGYQKWGLSATEADTMRLIMLTRQREGLPLFHFDRSRRAWYLNLGDFGDDAQVIGQFKEWEITVGEYRRARD